MDEDDHNDDTVSRLAVKPQDDIHRACCILCLGLRRPQQHMDEDDHQQDNHCQDVSSLRHQLLQAITIACQEYGGISHNAWSTHHSSPTVSLSGDFALRYQTLLLMLLQQEETESRLTYVSSSPAPNDHCVKPSVSNNKRVGMFLHQLKEHVRSQLPRECRSGDTPSTSTTTTTPNFNDDEPATNPSNAVIHEEEQGYLCVHVAIVPTQGLVQRPRIATPSLTTSRKRQRYRGPPSQQQQQQQGGDPRTNLEHRLQQPSSSATNSLEWWSTAEADHALEQLQHPKQSVTSNFVDDPDHMHQNNRTIIDTSWLPIVHDSIAAPTPTTESTTSSSSSSCRNSAFQIHVAVWRRPFFVHGRYTKHRRDVSQSPFFAGSERLGITSVEEEIVAAVTRFCGGISTRNNITTRSEPRTDAHHQAMPQQQNDIPSQQQDQQQQQAQQQQRVVFGMVKFHASGREDLDVRMLLPPPRRLLHHSSQQEPLFPQAAGGRPFVCQVIDARRMPTRHDLKQVVRAINRDANDETVTAFSDADPPKVVDTNHNNNNNGNAATPPPALSISYYGQNPMGVGISPDEFAFCSSDRFKTLQKETEEKVKYYGCLCWSQHEIASQESLETKLGLANAASAAAATCKQTDDSTTTMGPEALLLLQQRTPIRVLHRRVNLVRHRKVYTMQVQRIDDHTFSLYLSTEAGTYIKEFVHGDVGRTQPSISSLLQCKTDILELDCLGMLL
jgi:tRNA U54 and U55 pseudouridine synthase Pus10